MPEPDERHKRINEIAAVAIEKIEMEAVRAQATYAVDPCVIVADLSEDVGRQFGCAVIGQVETDQLREHARKHGITPMVIFGTSGSEAANLFRSAADAPGVFAGAIPERSYRLVIFCRGVVKFELRRLPE